MFLVFPFHLIWSFVPVGIKVSALISGTTSYLNPLRVSSDVMRQKYSTGMKMYERHILCEMYLNIDDHSLKVYTWRDMTVGGWEYLHLHFLEENNYVSVKF